MDRNVLRRLAFAVAITAVTYAGETTLWAEENAVTLAQIMTTAQENNGELKALRQELEIGEAGKFRAGLRANPVLELEGATGALTGSSSENRIAIGLAQEVLLGGKRDRRLAVAELELTRFGSRIGVAEQQLLLELKSGFYNLLLAEGRLDLARKSLELNSQLLRITKERLAAGDVAELDVNMAKVETARSEGKTIEAERELVPARLRLLALMGSPSLNHLKVADSPEAKRITADSAELKALALKNRPDLKAAEAERDKGEAEIALARAERLPNITAGIAFSREDTKTSIGGMEERNTDYLVGLRLSVPIQVFDRNQAGLREAQAKRNSAESRLNYLRQSIERDVEAARARLAAAEKSVAIYADEIIPQLTENLKLVQDAYSLGEVGILSVIEEQKKYIEVSDGYLEALYNRNIAVARLEAAVGVDLTKNDGGNK